MDLDTARAEIARLTAIVTDVQSECNAAWVEVERLKSVTASAWERVVAAESRAARLAEALGAIAIEKTTLIVAVSIARAALAPASEAGTGIAHGGDVDREALLGGDYPAKPVKPCATCGGTGKC